MVRVSPSPTKNYHYYYGVHYEDPDTDDESTTTKDSNRAYAQGKWLWDGELRRYFWVSFDGDSDSDSDASSSDSDSEDDEYYPQERAAYGTGALIVFDWDDTLLPTTALEAAGVDMEALEQYSRRDVLGDRDYRALVRLEASVVALLTAAMQLGRVKVVTDGAEGWVEYSAAHLMPRVYALLAGDGVEVISARSLHQYRLGDAWARKERVFDDEIKAALAGARATRSSFAFVSIGDSESERYAAHQLTGTIPGDCIKILKTDDSPSIRRAARQAAKIEASLRSYVASNYFVDVDV